MEAPTLGDALAAAGLTRHRRRQFERALRCIRRRTKIPLRIFYDLGAERLDRVAAGRGAKISRTGVVTAVA